MLRLYWRFFGAESLYLEGIVFLQPILPQPDTLMANKELEKSRKEAVAWVLTMQSESCTNDERDRFMEWLAKYPAHQALYAHYEAEWQNLDRFKGLDFPVRQSALDYQRLSLLNEGKYLKILTGLALIIAISLALIFILL